MRKLLFANFSRLCKCKIFWGEILTAAGMAGLFLFINQFEGASTVKYMDYPFFSQFVYHPVILAAFTALYLGTEYSDGTIRNKLSMNIQNKAVGVIDSVALTFAVMLLVSMLAGVLYAPEMVYEYTEKTANGLTYGPLVPNPGYIRGNARSIAEWMYDILPNGQLYSVYSYDFERCTRWPALSVITLAVSTAFGYFLFRKKDIK